MTEDGGQKEERKVIGSFEDLEVFKRAYRAAIAVHRMSLNFPEIEQRVMADQIRRASKSICANLAEGWGKHTRSAAEFKRYILIALGSAEEMRVWLRSAKDLGHIEETDWQRWRGEYQAIAAMLQSLHDRWT